MKKTSTIYILFIHWFFIVLFVFLFKLNDIAPTLTNSYTENIFRIGLIPWSDAKAWIDGAFQIADGQKLTGVPTCRPLYPLFLSCFANMASSNYLYFIFIQLVFLAVCIGFAFVIIKNSLNQSYIAGFIFMACLILWRTNFVTVFLTENLGMALLIISMALIWSSLEISLIPMLLVGYFMIGLSQAVRPWCVMILVTLPFLAIFMNKTQMNCFSSTLKYSLSRKQLMIMLFVSVIVGYSFQPIATYLFNEPGQGYANNSKTLYGQIVGGKGWTSVYNDPVILEAMRSNLSPEEIDRVIYNQCLKLFKSNPMNFFYACLKAFLNYFLHIPDAFYGHILSLLHWCIIFVFFILFIGIKESTVFFQNNSKTVFFISICVLCIYCFPVVFFCFGLVMGFFFILKNIQSLLSKFSCLYLLGIILSLPLVGYDGGERVKIGSDIFIFMITSKGIAESFLLFHRQTIENESTNIIRKRHYGLFVWIPLVAVFFLLLMPLLVYNSHYRNKPEIIYDDLFAKKIQAQLGIKELPIWPDQLDLIWHEYPEPSFEKVHNRPAFFPVRYAKRNTLFLKKNDGIINSNSKKFFIHWPLLPLAIDRTLLILEKRYTLFPKITPSYLEKYENKTIIVFGTLHARKRSLMNSTGFVLTVSHIGQIDVNQHVHWHSLIDYHDR